MNTARAAVPAGFKFTPTDEELISDYLVPMMSGLPAPPMTIIAADIYKTEPWNLPPEAFVHGDRSNEAFFHTPRRCTAVSGNCSRAQRAAGSGIWQINSKYVPVYDAYGQKVIGSKAPLVFTVNSAHTGWIMYEYISRDGAMFQTHALCRIYKKVRGESIDAMASCPTKRPKKQQNAHKETAEVKLQEAFMKMKEEASVCHAMASGPMAWGPALAAFLIKSKDVEGPHDPPVQDEADEQIQSPLLPLQSPPIPSPPRPPASWAQPSSSEPQPAATLDEFHGFPLIDPEELEQFRQDGKRWGREAAMDFLSDQPPVGVDIDVADYFYEDSTFFG